MFLQGTVRCQQCVHTSCVRWDVPGPMAEMCFCCVQQRAGATEGSNRPDWVAVCSRRQAQTGHKRAGENCTLTEKEILIRTAVYLGTFGKLRKATVSIVMRSCPSVRPHGKVRLLVDLFS